MTLEVRTSDERCYAIHVVDDGFGPLGALVGAATGARRAFVVTSPVVGSLYAGPVVEALRGRGLEVDVLEIPDGEIHKTVATWQALVEGLLHRRIDRRSTVVALGGGVVGDVAGFAAATVLRGVPLVQVPTTLLAMVDSAVGGKTGVNGLGGKNQVGAFHQPSLVFAALPTLRTLPLAELRSGLGEVLKHGLIRDEGLVQRLVDDAAPILACRADVLGPVVEACCRIKADIVRRDEKETGIRAILNFGHTVGHALESATGFMTIRHGECVALGLLAETRWAIRSHGCDAAAEGRIVQVLEALGLPLVPPRIPREDLVRAAGIDKKVSHGMLDTAVLERVGWARHERLAGADEIIGAMLDELRFPSPTPPVDPTPTVEE